MKQRLSHFSKSTLSVILSVCMLVSCLTVGLIATDAAHVTGADAIAAKVDSDSAVGDEVGIELKLRYLIVDLSDYSETLYSVKGSWSSNFNNWADEKTISSSSLVDFEDGIYILDTNAISSSWSHLRGFRLKYTSSSGTTKNVAVTASNTYNCIKIDASGNATWTTYSAAPFIAGRFRVKDASNNNVYTASTSESTTRWSSRPLTIPFKKTATTNLYKLETNCTLTELSATIESKDPYFFVMDYSTISSGSEGTAYYAPSSGTELNTTTTSVNLSTSGNNDNLKFKATEATKKVVIYYNASTHNLYYQFENYEISSEKKYTNDGTNYTETLSAGDDVDLSATTVTPGGTITATAPTISGYVFAQWSVSGGTVDDATLQTGATITPSANCTVTAQYKKIHTVTLDSTGNGTLAFHDGSSASVTAGDAVTIDSTPDANYAVSGWTISGNNYIDKTDGINSTTFKPTADVTVSATYSTSYTIHTSVTGGNGTIAPADGTQVAQDTSYTVTVTPDPGYGVDYLKLDGVNITSRLTNNDTTFTTTATGNASYVVKFKQLTNHNITAAVEQIDNVSPATITSITVNGAAGTQAMKGDEVVITYAPDSTNNASFNIYQYSSTSGVTVTETTGGTAGSSSGTVKFTMPDSDVAARLSFDDVDDVIYLTDAANWGTVKMHVSPTNGETNQWCAVNDLPVLPKSDDYIDVPYVIGNNPPVTHTIQVKYDSDKELYLIKGLSKANGGSMPYIRFYKSGDTNKKTDRVQAIAGTLYKTADSGSPVKTAANEFNYDTYVPEKTEPVVWPPSELTIGSDSGKYFAYDTNDMFTSNKQTQQAKSAGTNLYWVDVKALMTARGDSQLYIGFVDGSSSGNLSNLTTNSIKIQSADGTKSKTSDNESFTYSENSKDQYTVQIIAKNNLVSGSSDNRRFIRIKCSNASNLGILFNSSTKTYKIYHTAGGGGGSTSPTVKVWAKDATIRSDYSIYDGSFADTYLTDDNYTTGSGRTPKSYVSGTGTAYEFTRHSNYDYSPAVPKGSTIYFTTKINSSSDYDKYYLKAYCINGKCYNLHTGTSSGLNGDNESGGVYKESFTIPADWKDDYVEITPIYWLKDTATYKCIMLYVQGYSDEVQKAGWGNTIGIYPYYQYSNNSGAHNVNNAYGGYPGQPFVNYNGEYYAQLPTEYTLNGSKVTIKGVTFSNNFWDTIHRSTGEVSKHFQTYDYDDLYKIYKEGVAGNLADTDGNTHPGQCPEYVICSFKYRTQKNNDEPSSLSTSDFNKYKNGWEYLTDYYGNIVDIFGNKIEKSTGVYYTANDIDGETLTGYSGDTMRVISQDYRHNCAGKYATEWAIYNPNDGYRKMTAIVPSALIIHPTERTSEAIEAAFDKYDAQTKAYISNYKKLKGVSDYREVAYDATGKPALITYEKSIWGGADQADRCDARWYWSYEDSSSIYAKIKVQYSTDQGRTWIDDPYSNTSTGTSRDIGAIAKFTADTDGSNVTQTTGVAVNKNNSFAFTAKNQATGDTNYSFYGWAVERDGVEQEFSTKSTTGGQTEGYWNQTSPKSSGATFIARYIKAPTTGEFTIYHDQHPQSTGKGTLTVQVYEESSATGTTGTPIYENTSSDYDSGAVVAIPASSNIIKSDSTKFLRVVFSNSPRSDSEIDPDDAFYADVTTLLTTTHGKALDYISSVSIDKTNNTFTVVYNIAKMFSGGTQQVFSDGYMTKFKASSTIEYQIDYAFKTRAYGYKDYTVTGTLTEEDVANYFSDQMSTPEGITTLTEPFVAGKKPDESNFMQDFKWETEKVVFMPTVAGLLRAQLVATQEDNDIVSAVIYDPEAADGYKTRDVDTHYKWPFYPDGEYQEVDGEQRWVGTYIPSANAARLLYWDIFKLDDYEKAEKTYTGGKTAVGDTATRAQLRVAQCYTSDFTYVGFEDYYVRAVYAADGATVPDRQTAYNSMKQAYASELIITRNQWNNNVVRSDSSTLTFRTVGDQQVFDISDENDSASAYDLANTDYDRLYIDYVVAYDILGLDGPSIKATYNPRVKIEQIVDGDVKSTAYQNISNLDNKGRLEICTGLNGLTALNVTKGTIFRFTPVLGEGKTCDGFTSQSFEVDLYAYLNGEG